MDSTDLQSNSAGALDRFCRDPIQCEWCHEYAVVGYGALVLCGLCFLVATRELLITCNHEVYGKGHRASY